MLPFTTAWSPSLDWAPMSMFITARFPAKSWLGLGSTSEAPTLTQTLSPGDPPAPAQPVGTLVAIPTVAVARVRQFVWTRRSCRRPEG